MQRTNKAYFLHILDEYFEKVLKDITPPIYTYVCVHGITSVLVTDVVCATLGRCWGDICYSLLPLVSDALLLCLMRFITI